MLTVWDVLHVVLEFVIVNLLKHFSNSMSRLSDSASYTIQYKTGELAGSFKVQVSRLSSTVYQCRLPPVKLVNNWIEQILKYSSPMPCFYRPSICWGSQKAQQRLGYQIFIQIKSVIKHKLGRDEDGSFQVCVVCYCISKIIPYAQLWINDWEVFLAESL